MRLMPILACAALLTAAGLTSVARAFPQPSLYPISWELDFEYENPRRIVVEIPGQASPKAFWYMTYVATNNTQEDQLFLPKFEWVTKNGQVIVSDREATSAVFEAIARRERSRPLVPALKLQGQILVGEDQAKYGVAIWEEIDPRPGSFNIFISGLSGETAPLTDSAGKPMTDKDGNPIVLRKTRQLSFTVRGDELYGNSTLVKTGDTYVMR